MKPAPPSLRASRPMWSRLAINTNTHTILSARRIHDVNSVPERAPVNKAGVPLSATWSVRELLDSYSPPSLDDQTFEKIHRLSALIPPDRGTEEREVLRKELQDLVRLVNAVRVAEVPQGKEGEIPDGRIYPIPHEIDLDAANAVQQEPQASGRELLKHNRQAPLDSYSDLESILYPAMSLINEQTSASGSEKSKQHVFEDNDESESFDEGSENDLVDDGPNEDENELSQAAVEEYKAAQECTGVLYISRIPPGMSPNKVRHLLSAYGEIGRVYLQQEDPKRAYLRKKHTTSKKPHYTEGWVEFKSKKIARSLADMLNARPIGGKKGTRWAEDVWTMKYLPRFKWYMLTEQIAHERAVHAARLRMELSQSKKEQKHYLKQVEIGKSLEKRNEKKRKREENTVEGVPDDTRDAGKTTTTKRIPSDINKRHKRDDESKHRLRDDSRNTHRSEKQDTARDHRAKEKQRDLDAVLGSIF